MQDCALSRRVDGRNCAMRREDAEPCRLTLQNMVAWVNPVRAQQRRTVSIVKNFTQILHCTVVSNDFVLRLMEQIEQL